MRFDFSWKISSVLSLPCIGRVPTWHKSSGSLKDRAGAELEVLRSGRHHVILPKTTPSELTLRATKMCELQEATSLLLGPCPYGCY